ncbi:MAG: hypothetical protein WBG90_15895 [Saonia sp.]
MISKKNKHIFFEYVSRWYVFIFLNFYGLGKIMGGQFHRRGNLPEEVKTITLENADAFNLAWTFMGYSYGYILFVGILQIIGAWMLLWNKTKILGVLILIPIMVNIIMFDIFFLDSKRALVNAIIYFLLLNLVLYFNKEKVFKSLKVLTSKLLTVKDAKGFKFGILNILIILGLMALLFAIDQSLVLLVGR